MNDQIWEKVESEIDDVRRSLIPSGREVVNSYQEALEEGMTAKEAVEWVTDRVQKELESDARCFVRAVKEQLKRLEGIAP